MKILAIIYIVVLVLGVMHLDTMNPNSKKDGCGCIILYGTAMIIAIIIVVCAIVTWLF